MLLVLDDEHQGHIAYTTSVSKDVLQEFCKMAMEVIKREVNPKVYQIAAKKLQVEQSMVEQGINGLVYLLTESSKLNLSELDLHDSLLAMGYDADSVEVLINVYNENKSRIRSVLSSMSLQLPHYQNLEWRMDVQVASRSLKHQVEPVITMKLHTSHHDRQDTLVLQTDPVNLLHLTRELEQALQAARSQHARRIERNVK